MAFVQAEGLNSKSIKVPSINLTFSIKIVNNPRMTKSKHVLGKLEIVDTLKGTTLVPSKPCLPWVSWVNPTKHAKFTL